MGTGRLSKHSLVDTTRMSRESSRRAEMCLHNVSRIIPHVFGRDRPVVIDTIDRLKKVSAHCEQTVPPLITLLVGTGTRRRARRHGVTLPLLFFVIQHRRLPNPILLQEIASKLISSTIPRDADGNAVNPLDGHFRSLQLSKMEPVARASPEFTALERYTRDTHGATHRHYGVDVLSAFRVERYVSRYCYEVMGLTGGVGRTRLLRG